MQPTAHITISRTSRADSRQRQVTIQLDGQPFATLSHGQEKSAGLAPGPHTLNFDNTWHKQTVHFEAAAGEHIRFRVLNRIGTFGWLMVAVLGAGPIYLQVERSA